MIHKLPFVQCQHRWAMRISRWDEKCVCRGNRFAQEVNQRVVDARVADAGGGEKKFHNFFFWLYRRLA